MKPPKNIIEDQSQELEEVKNQVKILIEEVNKLKQYKILFREKNFKSKVFL